MNRTKLALLAMTSAPLALCAPFCAIAQAAPQDASAGAARATQDQQTDLANSGEIIVTATHRNERLQDVPQSIGVVTGAELRDRSAVGFADYLIGAPSVVFLPGAQNTYFFLRGVSSGSSYAGPTAGVYVDEVPISQVQGGASDLSPYDLNRVEILRGPQGTLFGAGSLGGVVRLILNQPKLNIVEASALARVTTIDGGAVGGEINAMVNFPLARDLAAVRITGTYRTGGGWIDDLPLGLKNYNSQRFGSIHGALLLKPTDSFDVTASVTHQNLHIGGSDQAFLVPGFGKYQAGYFVRETGERPSNIYSLVANYDFGWAKLTSASSYLNKNGGVKRDGTVLVPFLPQNVADAITAEADYRSHTFAQEVRLATAFSGPFQVLVGAFYQNGNPVNTRAIVSGPNAEAIFGANNYAFSRGNQNQIAGFGEATYKLLPNLELTAGVRVSDFKKTAYTQTNVAVKMHQTFADPKFSAAYKITPENMVYATASSGSRAGTPATATLSGLSAVCQTAVQNVYGAAGVPDVKPDKLWNYELGSKNRFGSITLNGDVYYEQWTAMQTSVALPLPCGQKINANAGKSTIKGAEIEISGRVTRNLTINGGLSYTHTELKEGVPAIGAPAGSWLPAVPRWTGNFSATYEYPVSHNARGYVRADYRFLSKAYQNYAVGVAPYSIPAYGLMGARIGVRWEKFEAAVFGTNLLNKYALTSVLSPNTFDRTGYTLQPRTIGIELRVAY